MRKSCFIVNFTTLLIIVFMLQSVGAQHNSKTIEIPVGSTFYDFIEGQGRKMAQATNVGGDGLHVVFDRQAPSSSFRSIAYDYYETSLGLFWGNQDISGGTDGFIANGLGDEAFIAFKNMGSIELMQDASEANFFFSNIFSLPNALTVGYAGYQNKAILSTTTLNNPLQDSLRISDNGFSTWISTSFPNPDPLTTSNGTIASAIINPANTEHFSFLLTPNKTATAPNGSLIKLTTINNAISWTVEEIHNDDNVYFNNTTYQVEDFSDVNGVYDSFGDYHIVTGAVRGFVDQNDPIFPILHWRTNRAEPEELTDPFYGRNPDSLVQQGLINFRPGNGLANAYPQIARAGDGYLFVAWQQWENNPDGSLRTLTGSAGEEVFATDIWGCIITPFGFPLPSFKIAGQEGFSDVFPRLPETLQIVSGAQDSLIVELLYLRDTDPGVSVLGQNNESLCDWIFVKQSVAIPITGVEQSEWPIGITDFNLSQNYPNPFNPSTTIS